MVLVVAPQRQSPKSPCAWCTYHILLNTVRYITQRSIRGMKFNIFWVESSGLWKEFWMCRSHIWKSLCLHSWFFFFCPSPFPGSLYNPYSQPSRTKTHSPPHPPNTLLLIQLHPPPASVLYFKDPNKLLSSWRLLQLLVPFTQNALFSQLLYVLLPLLKFLPSCDFLK